MRYWLFKTEPSAYSIDDLEREGVGQWTGVRNYQARNLLREARVGDRVLFYHSSTAVPAAVGVAEVVRAAYLDPTQFDEKSEYYDPKSTPENPRWSAVDVRLRSRFAVPASLADMRQEQALADMSLLVRGQRLSVQPVTSAQFKRVVAMGKGG